jgi:hypothetical protein
MHRTVRSKAPGAPGPVGQVDRGEREGVASERAPCGIQ